MPIEFTNFKIEVNYDKTSKSRYESDLCTINRLMNNYKELGFNFYFTGDSVLVLHYHTNFPDELKDSANNSQALDRFKAGISLKVISKKGVKPPVLGELERILGVSSKEFD